MQYDHKYRLNGFSHNLLTVHCATYMEGKFFFVLTARAAR